MGKSLFMPDQKMNTHSKFIFGAAIDAITFLVYPKIKLTSTTNFGTAVEGQGKRTRQHVFR